jgi:catechol 2,3-dioxygenase-like lactoylglutathione lyase family enzyme
MDPLTSLFTDFDRGTISRRQLLQALGIAVVAAPMSAFAQGQCGGARAGTAACDTVPAMLPFERTGWKTVYMDHFTMQCMDYKREAAFYAALMGWKVRSDDGTQVVMDIGDDVGSVVLRGGYVLPPPPPPPPPPAPGDSATGRGRGGGRSPVRLVWDSFCWGIEPWDAKKVEAELKRRGLNPVADNDSKKDFQSFHVKDPDGFDVQISNGNKKNRRQGPANATLSAPAPFEPTGWKTIWLDHISFAVTNYKESTAFYSALLGWKPTGDEGSQNECEIGDLGNVIIRGRAGMGRGGGGRGGAGGAGGDTTGGGRGGQAAPPPRHATINHISFGISPWDVDPVKAELDKRGLTGRPDTGGRLDIHDEAAHYKSYHTTTPDGWDLQISNATRARRTVR